MLAPEVLRARRAKEARAAPRYAPGSAWALRLTDMRTFHFWLNHEHHAYAPSRLLDPAWHKPQDAAWVHAYR